MVIRETRLTATVFQIWECRACLEEISEKHDDDCANWPQLANMAQKTDIILPMSRTPTEDWMNLIVLRQKTYEFRKVLYPPSVTRIWFYETAPISSIRYICDIGPPTIRPSQPSSANVKLSLLPEDGSIGNADYNNYALDYEGYNYAYPILGCWRLNKAISLGEMRETYGFKGAPRGMVYVKEDMKAAVKVEEQVKVW